MTGAERLRRGVLLGGLAAALAIRLALLFSFPGNFDTESYRIVAGILEPGGDPYRETTRYNYSPALGFLLLGAKFLADRAGARLTVVVGLFLLAADAASGALVYRLARRHHAPDRSALAALLFFANPVSILVSSAHGQFDNLSILFLLFAVAFAERERNLPAAASLSVSLIVKHVTWFHPLLFRRRPGWKGWAALFSPYLLFLLSFLPYASSRGRIWRRVFQHRGLTGYYGTEAMLLVPGVPEWAPVALFVVAAPYAARILRRLELQRACLLLFLVVLIFLPGFGRQYCVWAIALGALFPGPGLLLFTVVTSGFLLRSARPLTGASPLRLVRPLVGRDRLAALGDPETEPSGILAGGRGPGRRQWLLRKRRDALRAGLRSSVTPHGRTSKAVYGSPPSVWPSARAGSSRCLR